MRLVPRDTRTRGFALLVVLWTLVMLALVVTHLTATGGTETRIAGNLERAATAEAAADGAVYEGLFRFVDTSKMHWAADGVPHHVHLGRADATVRITPETGKINPNLAPPELLATLFIVDGIKDPKASQLAAAIADWREAGDTPRANGAKLPQYVAAGLDHGPPGEPFQSLDELGRVLGMTPELLARIRPHLSLFQPSQPDPNTADPVVSEALRRIGAAPPPPDIQGGLAVVSISADATTDAGGHFARQAIFRLGIGQKGYAVLAWDRPDIS